MSTTKCYGADAARKRLAAAEPPLV